MHDSSHIHDFLGDTLFRQVVEAEVDGIDGSLEGDVRERIVVTVSQRLQAEFEELLAMGTLRPEVVTVRIREETVRVIEGGGIAA